MHITILFRAALVWLIIAILAIANGALRDLVLTPLIGPAWALPLSGVSLSFIILLVTNLTLRFLGANSTTTRWLIGVQWVVMTLVFEFGLGHYFTEKSWEELLRSFNVLTGDLLLLVLFVSLIAPSLVARIRYKTKTGTSKI
ncbi:hypothetical protein [Sedimenticola hydrogenitrophicus]|uniref:hypothetical protein n=1 Tax=Sedimenticola hydrogenitrophicus TaxID=2967975 RepID=UPI0023AEB651|nr:hypothetical protein [Sedimenticola hydrogenitrophicus]